MLCRALEATGLHDFRVGLGDASLYPALLDSYGIPPESRGQLLHELSTRDFVGIERELGALGLDSAAAELLGRIPRIRGGADVLERGPRARWPTRSPACARPSRCSTPTSRRA